jgi:hypothetical protein
MSTPPSYRQISERTLGQAANGINEIPDGQVRTDAMLAHAAKAQAVAAIAIAQALLYIGDTLRDREREA